MNWRLKIVLKVILSRFGVPYDRWRKLGIFRLGQMDQPDYALKIFDMHVRRAFPDGRLDRRTVLEIGPGDSLASALCARAYGAAETLLVDAGAFASREVSLYRAMADMLQKAGHNTPALSDAVTLEEVLSRCSARYLTQGVQSFATLPDGSVDFIWSHSVLEHIPLNELPILMREMRRVLKPGGRMSHNVDFQDHLGHALNNLRFSEAFWEASLMSDAGFYTNRVRGLTMHEMMRDAGFELLDEGFGRWPELPTPRVALAPPFRDLNEDELLIRTSHVLAQVLA
jgi:SAM-dependent methyltransferase